MSIDGSGPVNLSQLGLHLGKAHAHLPRLALGQHLDGLFVDLAGARHAVDLGRFAQVDVEDLKLFLLVDSADGPVIDGHSVARHPVLLLQLGVQQVDVLGKLGGTSVQTLFKKVACPLEFGAAISRQELGQIGVPDIVDVGPLEQRDALLVGLEGLLKVVVFLEEEPVIDDDLKTRKQFLAQL